METRLTWQKLLQELCDVRAESEVLAGDLASEKTSRQRYQQDVKAVQRRLQNLQASVKQSTSVLVLLDADADGYTFIDEYLRKGVKGGQSAAQQLQRSVRDKLIGMGRVEATDVVVVRAFANVEGLSRTLREAGHAEAAENLLPFIQGFNQMKFCDFVAVGHGKDKADEKIRGESN